MVKRGKGRGVNPAAHGTPRSMRRVERKSRDHAARMADAELSKAVEGHTATVLSADEKRLITYDVGTGKIINKRRNPSFVEGDREFEEVKKKWKTNELGKLRRKVTKRR